MVANECFMVRRQFKVNGGGNSLLTHSMPLIVRRNAAIGDALCATVVADRLMDLGFEVQMQTHPAIHCVLRQHPRLHSVTEPGGFCHINLDGAYENDPNRRQRHFHDMFFAAAQMQLNRSQIDLGAPLNCKPRLVMLPNDLAAVRDGFAKYPRPWVMICPRSDTYNVRQVQDGTWQEIAPKINGTCFWVGRHPGPPGIVDLKCQHFDNVMKYIAVADLMVSVDTGPLHVAAALGIPMVAISQSSSPELHINDQNDFVAVAPGGLNCLNCQLNVCPVDAAMPPCQRVDPTLIAAWANARLRAGPADEVSAIIPIYQPELDTLNKCLNAVLPQVQEVIVTAEGNSKIPGGALQHPKIKYVRKMHRGVGYGRNFNFGARHSNGKYLLALNDDVFLDPGAVEALKAEMLPGVGVVANLLRYPDGTIYHAGKSRSPGVRGWGHIDLRHRDHTIKTPTEMENVCGACNLVRREAFYGINGFDERFFIYAEDDDFCLRMRKAGWKIRYTPHSTGVHMEHQSTSKLGDITSVVNRANSLFGSIWSEYFEHNANRIPGNFDYLKA